MLADEEALLSAAESRARINAARDSGRRQWLWPELDTEAWKKAVAAIADVTRMVLDGQKAELDGDPMALSVAGYTSCMGPLLGWWIESGALRCPAPVDALFRQHLAHNRARMATMADAAREAGAALAARGVATTVLKGMGTAFAVFPDPGARVMSDIDLLIAPADEVAAGEVLAGLGYVAGVRNTSSAPQQTWRRANVRTEPLTFTYVHRDDPWSIDLQTRLARRLGSGGRYAELDVVDDGSRIDWPLASGTSMLPAPLQFLQIAVHAGCSLESLSLLRQVELVLFARTVMRSALLWSEFVGLAERAAALGVCYPALYFARALAPDAVPDGVLELAKRAAPRGVIAIVAGHGAHDIQRVERYSFAERFMWADGWGSVAREFVANIVPRGYRTWPQMIDIYRGRLARLRHGTLSR